MSDDFNKNDDLYNGEGTPDGEQNLEQNVQKEEETPSAGYDPVWSSPAGGSMPNPPSGKPPVWRKVLGVVAAVGAFAVLCGGLLLAGSYFGNNSSGSSTTTETTTEAVAEAGESTDESSAAQLTIDTTDNVSVSVMDVSDVVAEVMPSVVSVTNTTVYEANFGSWGNGATTEIPGSGSGVIISQDDEYLLIVTNAHVVVSDEYSNYTITSQQITVTFADDTTADAIIKGTDEEADLAVIAVPLENISEDTMNNIKIATIGSSDDLEVGNGVIAIGNALGFGQSVTVGYVSALNRPVTIDDVTRYLLQTDAAINPGNSGGGLFNTSGQLIGINSAKYSSEDVEGIGYAIPISSAIDTIEELMNMTPKTVVEDEAQRGYLGVEVSDQYSLPESGALIVSVTEGSAADEAGLQAYDIITAIDGESVTSGSSLQTVLSYYTGGTEVTVTYLTLEESGNSREYVEKTTTATLGYRSEISSESSTEE